MDGCGGGTEEDGMGWDGMGCVLELQTDETRRDEKRESRHGWERMGYVCMYVCGLSPYRLFIPTHLVRRFSIY